MPIIRFIGDVHGYFNNYAGLIRQSPHRTHQVGDLGVGFRSRAGNYKDQPDDKLVELMKQSDATYNRGNHDNPEFCKADPFCIPDGDIRDDIMYIGGAVSIDKEYRREGYSWWPDEELSADELELLVVKYATYQPKIMVTHECPESIAKLIVDGLSMRSHPVKMEPRWASRTREAFEKMFSLHQPKLWIFGHWHVPRCYKVNGTEFRCIPELGTLDVDTDLCVAGKVEG